MKRLNVLRPVALSSPNVADRVIQYSEFPTPNIASATID
jgi:hypothetical protein